MLHRILVIDDDEALLASFRRWIKRELRCEVHCAADHEEAEALLDCYQYSLVLTDLSLTPHRLEGLNVVARVANTPARPKLIVLSGNGSKQVREDALRKGADLFLEKPTPVKEIIALALGLTQREDTSCQVVTETPLEGKLLTCLLESPDALTPYVQPVIRISGNIGEVTGVECLTRGPAGTPFEDADALFAYARHKRAESLIDRRCISRAFEAAAGLSEHLRISVNVHASTLGRDASFAEWLPECAIRNSISPSRLTVEIVEHATACNYIQLSRTLDRLRDAKVEIALDDVGLGESNYRMIVDTRPDYLKIDRYFVHGCAKDNYRRAILASIVKLAEQLRAKVVAEGIEDLNDLQVLKEMGVSLFQGYVFSRPVPSLEFSLSSTPLTFPLQPSLPLFHAEMDRSPTPGFTPSHGADLAPDEWSDLLQNALS